MSCTITLQLPHLEGIRPAGVQGLMAKTRPITETVAKSTANDVMWLSRTVLSILKASPIPADARQQLDVSSCFHRQVISHAVSHVCVCVSRSVSLCVSVWVCVTVCFCEYV